MSESYKALKISTVGEKTLTRVVELVREKKISDKCYAIKFRVKPEAALLEKKRRKLEEGKTEYKIESITDVVGLRLVTLFKCEMPIIYKEILLALKNPTETPVFLDTPPEEIILYKGNSAKKDLYEDLKAITEGIFRGTNVLEKNSTEGYSSIHIIARCTGEKERICNQYQKLLKDESGEPYRIPIEIQIRTVFEDAWGEIDHAYVYEHRTGKKVSAGGAGSKYTSAYVPNHMQAFKSFVDACMEYADCIRMEALGSLEVERQVVTKTISIDSDDDLLKRLSELGVEEVFIRQYSDARKVRERAEKEADKGDFEDAISSYLRAAELFNAMRTDLLGDRSHKELCESERLSYYYLCMNLGLCHMATNRPDDIQISIGIYQEIEHHYDTYPLPKMRLGQALGKANRTDESIQKLEAANQQMLSLHSAMESCKNWTDALPKVDYEHMAFTQPKLLGYAYWNKSRGISDPKEKAALFNLAYATTERCLEAPKLSQSQQESIENNLLYYAVGFVNYAGPNEPDSPKMKQRVLDHLGALEKIKDSKPLPIEEIDTLYKAYASIGRDVTAKEYAHSLRDSCLRVAGEISSQMILDMAKGAQHYIDHGKILSV